MKYIPLSQRSLKERREYWERVRGQYMDCLGEHGKEENKCGGCTRETQSDCIDYAAFMKEAEGHE